jgi:hypothetical protein
MKIVDAILLECHLCIHQQDAKVVGEATVTTFRRRFGKAGQTSKEDFTLFRGSCQMLAALTGANWGLSADTTNAAQS